MTKNEKGFSFFEALVVIAVVALIGMMTWFFIEKRKKTDNDNKEASSSSVLSSPQVSGGDLKPEDIVDRVKSFYGSKYKLSSSTEGHTMPDKGEMFLELISASPPYQVPGYKFRSRYDGGKTISLYPYSESPIEYSPRKEDSTLREEVAKLYADSGLLKTESIGIPLEGTGTDIYVGKGVVCSIESPDSRISSTYAACGLISEYEIASKQIKPFADALPKVDDTFIFGVPKITNSVASGYQKAQLDQHYTYGSGSLALFYRKIDSAWVYFKNSVQMANCSEYNNADLRSAFRGEPCYDDSNNWATSTVQ